MANLIRRYDPFREMDELMHGLVFKPMMVSEPELPSIKFDAKEDDRGYTITAEIPGAKKEDIKVSIDGGAVTISAEVKKEKEEKSGERVIRSERYFGQVLRSFTLPQAVDEAGAQAKYENGVLNLTLPKRNDTGSKKITVT
jgi:HSP20 family protein